MLDKETYKREYIRMMDSLRTEFKGEDNCQGVRCDKCSLERSCDYSSSFSAFEIIEAVEKWAKEHPVVTMADKFKEVFGVEPKFESTFWCCPKAIGFSQEGCGRTLDCIDCKDHFWQSEYKEPGKEKE